MPEPLPLWVTRVTLIALCLVGWFWSQRFFATRETPRGTLDDALHKWTAPVNRHLHTHPRQANALLIATSLIIDAVTLFVLVRAIFGPTFEPFVGLFVLFALRQACQALCALPIPDGQIWHDTGVPTLFVTYNTKGDLFFSGHTALAVYGGIQLASLGTPLWIGLGVVVIFIESVAVIVLRAHWTMDVFTAVVTAILVSSVGVTLAVPVDGLLEWAAGCLS